MNWPHSDFLFRANLSRYKEVSIYWKRIVIMKSWKETSFTTFFAQAIGRAHKYFWKLPMICQHREHSLGNFVFNWHIFIVILIQQWEGYSSYTWSRSSSRIFTRTGKTWRHQGKYRLRIKKNGDKPLTNLTRSFLFPNVKDNSQNRKKIEKAFCYNVSVLFYTIFSLTCKQCRFTKGR